MSAKETKVEMKEEKTSEPVVTKDEKKEEKTAAPATIKSEEKKEEKAATPVKSNSQEKEEESPRIEDAVEIKPKLTTLKYKIDP